MSKKDDPTTNVRHRDNTTDPAAVEAVLSGQVPEPAPGMAGESAPGQPSRAEVLAMAPELADSIPGVPTVPEDPKTGQENELTERAVGSDGPPGGEKEDWGRAQRSEPEEGDSR